MNMEICNAFLESTVDILKEMAEIKALPEGDYNFEDNEINIRGVCSLISFDGKFKGRLLIDMEWETALAIVKNTVGIQYELENKMPILSAVAEFNNTIAGDAVTNINNKYGYGLRLSSPAALAGRDVLICLDKIQSCSVVCNTSVGDIKLSMAFEWEE